MTPEEYAYWVRLFKKYSKFGNDRDLCHEFLIKRLEGKGLNQSVGFFVIDELRKTSGRAGSKKYQTIIPSLLEWSNVTNVATDRTDELNDILDLKKLVQKIEDPRKRLMVCLYYFEGFEASEIADMFEVCQSYIFQVLKAEVENLKHHALCAKPKHRRSP